MSEHAMTSAEFLRWLQQRLINVYGEDENTDFVLKTSEIASEVERLEREREWAQKNHRLAAEAVQDMRNIAEVRVAELEARVAALTTALRDSSGLLQSPLILVAPEWLIRGVAAEDALPDELTGTFGTVMEPPASCKCGHPLSRVPVAPEPGREDAAGVWLREHGYSLDERTLRAAFEAGVASEIAARLRSPEPRSEG